MNPIEYAATISYSSRETLEFTYEMAKKYADGKGVYVECGVAAGAQVIALAWGSYAHPKGIKVYDSFEGIPLPSNRDDQMPGIRYLTDEEIKALPNPGKQELLTTGATSVSIDDFWNHIDAAFGNMQWSPWIFPTQGWFEETMPKAKYEFSSQKITIDILRLDGDLYNSTWVCLENLFEFVNPGGCVIIDDWELPGCRAACNEYFNSIGYVPNYKYISNIAYFFK